MTIPLIRVYQPHVVSIAHMMKLLKGLEKERTTPLKNHEIDLSEFVKHSFQNDKYMAYIYIWHKSKRWKLEPHFTNLLLHPQLWTSHWRPRVHDLLRVFEAFQQLEGGILSGCSAFGCNLIKIRQFSHVLSDQNGASSDAITRVTLTQANADDWLDANWCSTNGAVGWSKMASQNGWINTKEIQNWWGFEPHFRWFNHVQFQILLLTLNLHINWLTEQSILCLEKEIHVFVADIIHSWTFLSRWFQLSVGSWNWSWGQVIQVIHPTTKQSILGWASHPKSLFYVRKFQWFLTWSAEPSRPTYPPSQHRWPGSGNLSS